MRIALRPSCLRTCFQLTFCNTLFGPGPQAISAIEDLVLNCFMLFKTS